MARKELSLQTILEREEVKYPFLRNWAKKEYGKVLKEHDTYSPFYTIDKIKSELINNIKYLNRYGYRTRRMTINPKYQWVKGNTNITLDYLHPTKGWQDHSSWVHRHQNIECLPQHSWAFLKEAQFIIREIVIVLDLKEVQRIKWQWGHLSRDGRVVSYGYGYYAKIVTDALSKNIPVYLRVTEDGKQVSLLQAKNSLKDCIIYTPKSKYTYHTEWYDKATMGYPVNIKVSSKSQIGSIKYRAEMANVAEDVIISVPADSIHGDVYHEYYASELSGITHYYKNNKDERIAHTVQYDAESHLSEKYEAELNIIERSGKYIGTLDRRYNARLRGLIKSHVLKGEYHPIGEPTKEINDSLIKEYFDFNFYGSTDLNVLYHKMLRNPKYKEALVYFIKEKTKDNEMYVEYLKDMNIHEGKRLVKPNSLAWNDIDAELLGISEFKEDKVTDMELVYVGKENYLEHLGDDDAVEDGVERFQGSSSLPTQNQVDRQLDAKRLLDDINTYLKEYVDSNFCGATDLDDLYHKIINNQKYKEALARFLNKDDLIS